MRAVIVATVLIGLGVPVSVEPVQYTVFIPLVSGTGNHRLTRLWWKVES